MQYRVVMSVSSLPVAAAEMAVSVHTWLTKHEKDHNVHHFYACLSFFTVRTENAIFVPTTGRLDMPITALYCISKRPVLETGTFATC